MKKILILMVGALITFVSCEMPNSINIPTSQFVDSQNDDLKNEDEKNEDGQIDDKKESVEERKEKRLNELVLRVMKKGYDEHPLFDKVEYRAHNEFRLYFNEDYSAQGIIAYVDRCVNKNEVAIQDDVPLINAIKYGEKNGPQLKEGLGGFYTSIVFTVK